MSEKEKDQAAPLPRLKLPPPTPEAFKAIQEKMNDEPSFTFMVNQLLELHQKIDGIAKLMGHQFAYDSNGRIHPVKLHNIEVPKMRIQPRPGGFPS